jgi:hypothetical protein
VYIRILPCLHILAPSNYRISGCIQGNHKTSPYTRSLGRAPYPRPPCYDASLWTSIPRHSPYQRETTQFVWEYILTYILTTFFTQMRRKDNLLGDHNSSGDVQNSVGDHLRCNVPTFGEIVWYRGDSHLFLPPVVQQPSRPPNGTGSGNERTSKMEQEEMKWRLPDKVRVWLMHKPELPAQNFSMWKPQPSNKAFSRLLLIERHSSNDISGESHPTRDTKTEMSHHKLLQRIDSESLPGLYALNLMTA